MSSAELEIAIKRIVVKIGSALLVDRSKGLKQAWLESLCADVAALDAIAAPKLCWSPPAPSLWAAPCSTCRKAR